MATIKLNLPTISGNMTADVVRDVNALAEAVDEKAASSNEFDSHKNIAATTTAKGHVQVGTNINVSGGTISVANGTTSVKGVVQLSSATNNTSTTLAATPSAVKAAYDLAESKQNALPVEQRRNIYIGATAPTSPVNGDIWIEV